MFGPDPNWFMSLVMLYIPFVVSVGRAAWTWLRRQIATVPIEVRR